MHAVAQSPLVSEARQMRCPELERLPEPPAGKAGWPWTEESGQLPDRMPDGKPWPRISIARFAARLGGRKHARVIRPPGYNMSGENAVE